MEDLTIAAVIAALQERPDDPVAVARSFNEKAELREVEAEALRSLARAIFVLAEDTENAPQHEATGPSPAESPGAAPVGIEAVRRIVRAGGVWRAKDVHTELERRGWASKDSKEPIRSTEAAISRLFKRGELDRVGRGQYRWAEGPPASPGTVENLGIFAASNTGGGDEA